MKKIKVGFLLFVLLLCYLLAGCSSQLVSVPQLIGMAGEVDGLNLDKELSEWHSTTYSDMTQPQNLQIEVFGNTISGTYQDSLILYDGLSLCHRYKNDDGKTFFVNSKGKLVQYAWNAFDNESETDILTEEEMINNAYGLIEQLTQQKLDDYSVNVSFYNVRGVTEIVFQKYLNGIPTTDKARVWIYRDGTPVMFEIIFFGTIPAANTDRAFDLNGIDLMVTEYCNDLTKEAKELFDSVEYSDWTHVLTTDEKGQYYILVTVSITFKRFEGETESNQGTRLQFVLSV